MSFGIKLDGASAAANWSPQAPPRCCLFFLLFFRLFFLFLRLAFLFFLSLRLAFRLLFLFFLWVRVLRRPPTWGPTCVP